MKLRTMSDAGRAKRNFPTADYSAVNCEGKASSGPDAAMVEEIMSIGFEVVDVKRPTTIRKGYTKLVLFIALTVKRNEPAIIGAAELK
jgi:hypothetical protein